MRSEGSWTGKARPAAVMLAILALLLGLVAWDSGGGATAATVTLPNMRILVPTTPTGLISIAPDATTGHRMLRFTHITENAGTGPFELDPTYNPGTGISTFVQAIYNSPSAGVWNRDHTVPVAVNGIFAAPSDYIFPLTRFTLNALNGDGTVGPVLLTSPKTDYCITGDNRVADVPNTPTSTTPPQINCTDPTKPLGWSVGWGDQYDQTDSGQPIDINTLANGTYVLRATADPQHVLTESDTTDNVTDTVLTINGTTVTVGAQTRPSVTPPSATLTSPTQGATVSGTVTLSVAASAPAPAAVSSVQYLLDGNPIPGSQTAAAPYSYAWTVGSTPAGSHNLSVQVTDSVGSTITAPVVTVNVQGSPPPGGFGVDRTITQNGHGTTTTAAFSTGAAGETLVALVGSDGPTGAASQSVTVSGAGLTWSRVRAANARSGDSEIWTANAANALSAVTVTSTPAVGNFDQLLTVLTFASGGGVGAAAIASASTGAPGVALTTTAAGSLSYAVGNDYDTATARTVGSGQAIASQWVDVAVGDTFWVQGTSAVSPAAGLPITLNDTAPTADQWNLAAVEVRPNTAPPPPPRDTTPPTAAITSPGTGQTVSGTVPVAATANDNVAVASVQFLLDGQPLGSPVTAPPYSVQWNTTTAPAGPHTLAARATDSSSNIGTSASVTVTVQNPPPTMTCFVLQAQKSVHGTGTVTTPAFTTAMAGEVLFAFVGSDGPTSANSQTVAVSGAGLTWRLVRRANAQYGDSEIWTANAPAILTNVTVRSTPARGGFDQDLTVIAMEGVLGAGASVAASAASGAPSVSLTTTAGTSLVFAVGNDWDRAAARTFRTGLVTLDQWVDTRTGDTFWSEYTNQPTGATGSVVAIGATAPTNDRWNLVAVELLGEG